LYGYSAYRRGIDYSRLYTVRDIRDTPEPRRFRFTGGKNRIIQVMMRIYADETVKGAA
jgi:hypothetical protein